MEEKEEKIGFFKRIKIAIFQLEEYGFFLGEKFSVSVKYFLLLVLLLSLIVSGVDTYKFQHMLNKGYTYITNELPDFSYEEGNLHFEKPIQAYDEEYHFKLVIDTNSQVSEEQIRDYKNEIYSEDYGVILLEKQFVYIANGQEQTYAYSEFLNQFSIDISTKAELLETLSTVGVGTVATTFFFIDGITIYISNIIVILGDILLIALFGLIAARFCGMKFKILPMISLSIYALTLPIVLTAIYSVVYALTGFVINYFNIMYLLIAYVYLIAAILMIKYDLIKHHFELAKIMEVQKQVKKEIEEEEKEETEEEKKEEEPEVPEDKKTDEGDEKTDLNTREPDGSEI